MKAGTSEGGFQLLVYPTLAEYLMEVDFDIDNIIKNYGFYAPFHVLCLMGNNLI